MIMELQFTSYEYKRFSQERDFKHITSSPRYPKSNGFLEQNIQTVKRVLQKSLQTGDDPPNNPTKIVHKIALLRKC